MCATDHTNRERITFPTRRSAYSDKAAWDYAAKIYGTGPPFVPKPYPVILGGLLDSPEKIQEIARLAETPPIEEMTVVPMHLMSSVPRNPDAHRAQLAKMPLHRLADGRDVVRVCMITPDRDMDGKAASRLIAYVNFYQVEVYREDGDIGYARFAMTRRLDPYIGWDN